MRGNDWRFGIPVIKKHIEFIKQKYQLKHLTIKRWLACNFETSSYTKISRNKRIRMHLGQVG